MNVNYTCWNIKHREIIGGTNSITADLTKFLGGAGSSYNAAMTSFMVNRERLVNRVSAIRRTSYQCVK